MSLIPKKIDFSCVEEEPEEDIPEILVQDMDGDVGHHSMGITSSPVSRKLLLQSPRKVKLHVHHAFRSWTEVENRGYRSPNEYGDLPLSPLSSRLLPESASSGVADAKSIASSPPYRRVRNLRLFDSPLTPKTLYEKSSMLDPQLLRTVLFHPRQATAACSKLPEKPVANVNPFSPAELLRVRKRKITVNSVPTSPKSTNTSVHSSSDDSSMRHDSTCPSTVEEVEVDEPVERPAKRIALNQSNISRYHQEFHELELIGEGVFGSVHKCINRLDGCLYAVKRSIQPIAGSSDEIRALNEVYAHAILGSHRHVVRYYSAWSEENHVIIQNEFCGGGSLSEKLSALRKQHVNPPGLPEAELRRVVRHVSRGLSYIHKAGLVHLDIKPGNIFIAHEAQVVPVVVLNNSAGSNSEDFSMDENNDEDQRIERLVYKIGDLGHVTSLEDPKVEEGDCRYLPKEILAEDFTDLTKADIFSLGLTTYEAAGAGPLPKNGDAWHEYRNGQLPDLPYLSTSFNKLIKSMVHIMPSERPSALQVCNHPEVCPPPPQPSAREAELQQEVNRQRLHSQILQRQLEDANRLLLSSSAQHPQSRRLVGLRAKRSMSATNF